MNARHLGAHFVDDGFFVHPNMDSNVDSAAVDSLFSDDNVCQLRAV